MAAMGAIALGVYFAGPAPTRSFPILNNNSELVYPLTCLNAFMVLQSLTFVHYIDSRTLLVMRVAGDVRWAPLC